MFEQDNPAGPAIRSAMVFAAGLGKRMRPVTDTRPKPMVEVAGRPLIDHMLDRLDEAGIGTAVVNVHYLPDQIIAHLKDRARPRIVISDERDRLLDQGGGIKAALPHLGEAPFLVCNTDAIWIEGPRSNIGELIRAFDPARMDALLLVASTATAIGVDWMGDFTMDAEGRLTRRTEKTVAPFVYAGVAIMQPGPFAAMAQDIFPLAPFFFEAATRGRLFGLRLDGRWLHVGTPDAIDEAERAIADSAR